ncbi:MAG TPA: ABC transporter permease, partial [Nakamurella sp.]
LAPAAVGTVLGGVLGVVLALPLLGDTDRAYDLPDSSAGIPLWIMVVVPVAALVLVALASFGPALRAGRLAANQAISIGRAPRAGRGFRLRRLLTASRLPRSVALGAGMPLARPARAAGTVVALILGAVTLVFAVGLTSSLDRIHTAFSRVSTVPVTIPGFLMFTPNSPSDPQPQSKEPAAIADLAGVQRTVDAQPGTAHSVIVRDVGVHVSGFNQPVTVEAYDGDARWTGFAMISGRWYAGPDEVVASSYLLRQSGFDVGDHLTVVGDRGTRVVTVVGDFMDGGDNYDLVAAAGTVAGISTVADGPESRTTIEIGLKPGTNATTYATALQAKFPDSSGVFVDNRSATNSEKTFLILDALITTLTVLLCSVAALGVLNTVVLNTRERVHDIGVLKSLGMTPRQVRGMIITSMVGLGVIGALVAVPLGVLLHHYILPTMAAAAGTGVAPSIVDVYHPVQLIVLGVAGVALAVVGALLPAGWAARTRVSNALRAE